MRHRRSASLVLALVVALAGALVPSTVAAQRARATDGSAVRIVRVAVPADTGMWDYAITLIPDVRALGALTGRTAGGAPLAVTVQIGAQLNAGPQPVGTVTFTRGSRRVEQPLLVEVAARRALAMQAATALAVATPGEDVALLFSLRNDGNAPDSLTLVLDAPGGWNAAVAGPTTIALAPRGAALVRVVVRTPGALAAGGTRVQLRAIGRTTTAEAQTIVEVGATRAQADVASLQVNSSLSYLGGSNGLSRSLASLTVAGPLVKGLDIAGELVSPIGRDEALAVRGASTVGLPIAGSRLRLSSERTTVELGRVAVRLPELAGRAMGGDGVAVAVRGTGAGAVGAAVMTDETGTLTQGALTWSGGRGPLAFDAAAVRLRSGPLGEGATRALDALAVGARAQLRDGLAVGVELADRATAAGHDLGLAADLAWEGTAGRATVRAQHAPGGASALAIARDALNAESLLRFGERWTLASHGWVARDGGASGAQLASGGGAITPALRIGRTGEIGLLASTTGFSSENAGTLQQTRDQELGLRTAGPLHNARWELEGSLRAQERRTRMGPVAILDRADRLAVRSGLAVPSRLGTIGLRGGFAAANESQASEASFELQASELRPLRALPWLSLDLSMQRAYLGRASMDHARLSARAFLPGDLSLQLGLERESWHGMQVMPSRTTVALRLSRAARLAGAERWRSRRGVVFEDLDDDGVRDEGEPAVAGVTLRSGTTTVTSDREGGFRLAVDAAAPEIDVRTLRADQRPGTAGAVDRWAIPVRTVGRLTVSVRRIAVLPVANVAARPATIVVTARGANGAEWRALLGRDGIARFDALPVGPYSISAATVESAAVLRVEAVTVQVDRGTGLPGVEVPHLELVERDRPVRLQGGNAGLGVNALIGTQNGFGLRLQDQKQDQRQELKQQERQQQERQQQERQQQERGTLEKGGA